MAKTIQFEDMTFLDQYLPFTEYLPICDASPTPKVDVVVGRYLAWCFILCSQSLVWLSDKVPFHKFCTLRLSSGDQLEQNDNDSVSEPNIQKPTSAVCSKVK